MTFSVVYSPSCTVTHSIEGADLLLKCSADANPEVVSSFGKLALKVNFFGLQAELSWSVKDTPLEGKAGDGGEDQQTSFLRLELSDNSTGDQEKEKCLYFRHHKYKSL